MVWRSIGFLIEVWVMRSTFRLKNTSNFSQSARSCSPRRIGSWFSISTSKSISLDSGRNESLVTDPNAYSVFTSCAVHNEINSVWLVRICSSKSISQITKY